MATTQYIGARYVPKFFENGSGTAEWTANTQYEPLTIVTRNGNSYTSKKFVPASVGAPEDNASYWASTGIYNEQLNEYIQIVDNLRINRINDGARLNERKIIIIADSYGDAAISGTPWTTVFKNVLGLTEGVNVFTYYQGGAGFANGAWLTLFNNHVTAVDETITDVLVAGGCNDYGHTSEDIRAAITSFYTSMHEKLPNALLTICTIGHTLQQGYRDASAIQIGAYAASAAKGIRILSGTENILHVTNMYTDDVHPNAIGAKAIGEGVANAFLTGYCTVARTANPTLTAESPHTVGSANIYEAQHNNMCILSIYNRANAFGGGIRLEVTDGIQLNTDYDVAAFSTDAIIYGNSEHMISAPFAGTIYYSGNNHSVTGTIKIFGGHLYIAITSVDNATPTLPAAATINFSAIYITADAIMC